LSGDPENGRAFDRHPPSEICIQISDSPVTSHPVSVGDKAENPEDFEMRELTDAHAERISQFRKSSLTPSQRKLNPQILYKSLRANALRVLRFTTGPP
jgi:hypothetical protein